ncbi:hypothetical protein AURDEDRAFT_87562 [Auricularia subglabra TFB-10046 SS5]|nr:hypothetical protein AURDEDRAFT_87562 [Auricularia subglabra TFB-10046 SS5]
MSENSTGQQHPHRQHPRPARSPDDPQDPAAAAAHAQGASLSVVPPRRPYVRQSSAPSPLSPFPRPTQSPVHAYIPSPYVAYPQRSYQAQYTMAPQPPAQVVQSPPHFAYTHAYAHPSIIAHDPSPLSALGYRATPTPQQPASAIFPFLHPQPPPESVPGSSDQQHLQQQQQQQQQQQMQQLQQLQQLPPPPSSPHTPHTTQATFSQYPPMHYPASPQSFYPPHTYSPTGPAMYTGQYQAAPPYGQSFMQPSTGDESKGTWWFFPSQPVARPSTGFEHSFASAYPASVGFSSLAEPQREQQPTTTTAAVVAGAYPSPVAGPLPPLSPFPSSPAALTPGGFPRSGPPSSEHPHSPMLRSPRSPASTRMGQRGGNRSPVTRMAYHPTVPASRSEWVMWVGNVPSDATEDELRAFFNAGPPGIPGQGPPSEGGVTSVFLIARSNCAFVNFRSQAHLERAVHYFNGQPLRPADARCPRLVCRVRKKDDDLQAGVGGQRGMGMHTRWVRNQDKEQQEREREAALAADPRAGAEERPGPVTHPRESTSTSMASNSSGSYASTNSSFLSKHFPKRYFIMKSLTEQQLLKSVECGLWSTQKHNQSILDQAYRTSKDVFLIFSANKSGEFFGYARMAGRVVSGEAGAAANAVGWHSRAESLGQGLPNLKEEDEADSEQAAGNLALPRADDRPRSSAGTDSTLVGQSAVPARMFPEAKFAEASPSPLTPGDGLDYTAVKRETSQQQQASAPPELGKAHEPISYEHLRRGADTWDNKMRDRDREPHSVEPVQHADAKPNTNRKFTSSPPRFSLDPEAAVKAVREPAGRSEPAPAVGGGSGQDANKDKDGDRDGDKDGADWGTPFRIEWICTTRLPFQRTRNLRNPWNHDREVKVSRDGTELEPSVGQRLLEEWARPDDDPAQPVSSSIRRPRGARGGGGGQQRPRPGADGQP